MEAAVQEMQRQQAEKAANIQKLLEQNQSLNQRLQAKDAEVNSLRQQVTAATQQSGPRAEDRLALVQKWAPSEFSGEHSAWRDWAVKFRSYVGQTQGGTVGRWITHVETHRDDSAVVAVLGEDARSSSAVMHSALIATCQGKALVLTERAGQGEGLEAWRQLLRAFEPRSKQTRVMRLLEVLLFKFRVGQLQDDLARFERSVSEYEKEAKATLSDDIKVGVVIAGIDKGSLKEHLLLHAERCDVYDVFRTEIDTIVRART